MKQLNLNNINNLNKIGNKLMKNFIQELQELPYTKDNKINVSHVLSNMSKIIPDDLAAATALSILILNNKNELAEKFIIHANGVLNEQLIFAVKGAVSIMNMNNVYYRGKHLLGDEYKHIQPQLRMTFYAQHGIDKKYFEFISLAVSFVNNCEYCVKSHAAALLKEGMTVEQVHEALRIAAIFNAIP